MFSLLICHMCVHFPTILIKGQKMILIIFTFFRSSLSTTKWKNLLIFFFTFRLLLWAFETMWAKLNPSKYIWHIVETLNNDYLSVFHSILDELDLFKNDSQDSFLLPFLPLFYLPGLWTWAVRSRSVGSGFTVLKTSPPSSSWPPSASTTRSWRKEKPL